MVIRRQVRRWVGLKLSLAVTALRHRRELGKNLIYLHLRFESASTSFRSWLFSHDRNPAPLLLQYSSQRGLWLGRPWSTLIHLWFDSGHGYTAIEQTRPDYCQHQLWQRATAWEYRRTWCNCSNECRQQSNTPFHFLSTYTRSDTSRNCMCQSFAQVRPEDGSARWGETCKTLRYPLLIGSHPPPSRDSLPFKTSSHPYNWPQGPCCRTIWNESRSRKIKALGSK